MQECFKVGLIAGILSTFLVCAGVVLFEHLLVDYFNKLKGALRVKIIKDNLIKPQI